MEGRWWCSKHPGQCTTPHHTAPHFTALHYRQNHWQLWPGPLTTSSESPPLSIHKMPWGPNSGTHFLGPRRLTPLHWLSRALHTSCLVMQIRHRAAIDHHRGDLLGSHLVIMLPSYEKTKRCVKKRPEGEEVHLWLCRLLCHLLLNNGNYTPGQIRWNGLHCSIESCRPMLWN